MRTQLERRVMEIIGDDHTLPPAQVVISWGALMGLVQIVRSDALESRQPGTVGEQTLQQVLQPNGGS